MRTHRLLLTLLAISAGILALTARPSQAQNDVTSACRGDYVKLCFGVTPGEGRIAACLMRNRAALAPACRTALDAAFACRPEIERHCRQAKSPDALRGCLNANADKLGAECIKALGTF